MQYLGLLFTLSLLAVNIWGLMLIAGVYWRNRWFALASGPILAVTAVYAVECHYGLGPTLPGLGLFSTVVSVALITFSCISWEPRWLGGRWAPLAREWRAEFAPRRLTGCFGICIIIFLYAMSWRFIYPDIDGSSEKIADFSYICSYYTGTTIPVPDVWFSPYLSTQYYSFQHYAAALMGRVLLLPTGSAYNIAYCLLIALGGTAFAGSVFMVARKAWTRTAVIACFVIGGTGVTILDHFTDKEVSPWTTMRFIGSAQMDKPPLGPWLKAYNNNYPIVTDNNYVMELPGEIYSYVVFLGDYHAPLSGYYLLGLCAMAMLLWTRSQLYRYAAMAGCTLTWTLLANTWVLPLQGLAVAMWLGVNWRDWRRLVPAVATGAALVWLAAWVYLSAFTAAASGYDTAVRLVPWVEHTPPLLFVLFFLPTIAFIVLGFVSGNAQGRRLAMLWLLLLLFTEFFYVDDEYSGHFDRFNTTLKWWPWVMAGTLMTLAPVVLEPPQVGARRRIRLLPLSLLLRVRPVEADVDRAEGLDGQDRGHELPHPGRVPAPHARAPQGREAGRRHREARREGRLHELGRHPALRRAEDVARVVGPRAAVAREPGGRPQAPRPPHALLQRGNPRRRKVAGRPGNRLRPLVQAGRHARDVGEDQQGGLAGIRLDGHPHLPERGRPQGRPLEAGARIRALSGAAVRAALRTPPCPGR